MLKNGDSVRVKSGVTDPDLFFDIGGWQGRVREVDAETVDILWDSMTLRQMGIDLVIRCENENLDWRSMALSKNDVQKAQPRDTEADVDATERTINEKVLNDPRFIAE